MSQNEQLSLWTHPATQVLVEEILSHLHARNIKGHVHVVQGRLTKVVINRKIRSGVQVGEGVQGRLVPHS